MLCDFCGNFYHRHFNSCPQCFAGKTPRGYRRAVACFPYEGSAKELALHLKFHNGRYLAEPMARLILDQGDISENGLYTVLVPVPLSRERYKERGYNQAAELARELSYFTGLELVADALVKVKDTPSQATLSGAQRRGNLAGAFTVKNKAALSGKYIILVDDIITTGSTVHQCAKELKKAGAKGVKALAFCGASRGLS